jgi:pentose-5-phosphate-3-epimerase
VQEENVNVITMLGDFGAAKKAAAKAPAVDKTTAKRLQAALVTLGKVTGSAQLKAIVVDGALGAKTAAGVNWAFTKHLGAGQAPAELRTGALDLAFVKANAAALADLIETEIARRGGTAASPATVTKAAAIQAVKAAPVSSATSKASAKRLQAALVNLGKVTGSAKLKVAVDGAIGPKTVTAVNWAFTQHIGAGQAAAQYRTGQLALAYIKSNAETLALLLEAEIKRRGGSAAVTTAATAAAPAVVSKAAAKALQTALYSLGKVAGSARLQIAVDGALGPKTVDATNWAFTQHVGAGQAPAQFRTGKLALNDVKANVGALTSLLTTEVQRRGGSLVVPTTAKKKVAAVAQPVAVKTKTGKVVKATKVATAKGETYKVTDPETGDEYYTPDPTAAPPPKTPAGLPTPSAEQEAEAAEASAEAAAEGRKLVTTGTQFEPGGTSFFSEYKWPILGGVGAVLLLGVGYAVLKKRPQGQTQYQPQLRPARATR